MSQKSKPMYYNLVSATIVALDKETETPTQVSINCTLASEKKNISAKDIGKAQQMAQVMFFKHVEIDAVTVIDVHINSISHLGLMTQKEFLAEVPKDVVDRAELPASEPMVQEVDSADPFLSSVTTAPEGTH